MDNNIKNLRKESKVSQQELAKSINISRPYLSEIENDKANPTLDIAFAIAKYFKKDINEIFFNLTSSKNDKNK